MMSEKTKYSFYKEFNELVHVYVEKYDKLKKDHAPASDIIKLRNDWYNFKEIFDIVMVDRGWEIITGRKF